MNVINRKFVALAIAAIASTATGCTNLTQNPTNSPMSDAVSNTDNGMMNHGTEMDLGAADVNYDLRFIDAMMMHHQGAVVMAKDAISKSTRPEVKQLNQDILTSQQAEIKQMQQWRKAWYNK